MAFHSSRSTATRPKASQPEATARPAQAGHEAGDPHSNGAQFEDPLPVPADRPDSTVFSAASVSLKADSEAPASLGSSPAGTAPTDPLAPATVSATHIPPVPGAEREARGTVAADSPIPSAAANPFQLRSAPEDMIADAPSVSSDGLSIRGPEGGIPLEDAGPTDVIELPTPADAAHAHDRVEAEDPLATGGAGTSSDRSGQSGTLERPALASRDSDSRGGKIALAASSHENDPDFKGSSLDRIVDALSDPSAWVEATVPDFGSPLGSASSDRKAESTEPDAPRAFEDSADVGQPHRENAEPTVIALPDLSGGEAAEIDDGYLRQLADTPAVSSDRHDSEFDDLPAQDAPTQPVQAAAPTVDGAPRAGRRAETAPLPGETVPSVPASDRERVVDGSGTAFAALDRGEAPAAPTEGSLDDGLIRSIVDEPSVLSDVDPTTPASARGPGDEAPEETDGTPAIPEVETVFDAGKPNRSVGRSDVPDGQESSELHDIRLETVPPGPSRALAFAADPDTEAVLRDGLLGYEGFSPGHGDPQVWQGGLRAAIAALNEGHSAPLLFVDIDRIAYPAGAIHELAAVCEVGTVVIALGSDNSARPSRDLLLAGVSDYLAKPLTAEAVRAAANRAAPDAATRRPGGCVAGFVGCGGSGTTTLLTAAALQAAERGCYVSVLDLDRSVAAAALALGVEPAAGLDQLLEAAGRDTPDPEMVEGVCTLRSDRVHVYAHRWSTTLPALPSPAALDTLLAVLRNRSQLVLVDGLDEPAFRFCSSSEFDTRVFVAEPTTWNVAHLGRTTNLLDGDPPLLFVQNHTRAFRRGRGERALRNAGLGIAPDITIPFEPMLPEATDRGWPQPRLPRCVRKPVRELTDRLLETSRVVGAGVAAHPNGSA